MELWIPYERVRNHPPDFRIRYQFYSEEESGRKNPVFQGLRCDFAYDGDNIKEKGIFAIHPDLKMISETLFFTKIFQYPNKVLQECGYYFPR